MNIKSLLLGSAAAAVAFTGAQAADAIIIAEPEPMEYVRICDTYGTGFFYIPGTENCLKIGGYVRYQMEYNKNDGADYTFGKWLRFAPSFDARNATEWGTLRSYAEMEFEWASPGGRFGGYTSANEQSTSVAHAFISLENGPHTLLVGKTDTPYHATAIGGLNAGGIFLGNKGNNGFVSGTNTGIVSYQFNAGNGLGVTFAAVEPTKKGTSHQFEPNLEAVVRYSQGWGVVVAAAGYDNVNGEWGGKIGGEVKFDPVTVGLVAAYGSDENSAYGSRYADGVNSNLTSEWSVLGYVRAALTDKVSAKASLQWFDGVTGWDDAWQVTAGLDWKPVSGLAILPEIRYTKSEDALGVDHDQFRAALRFQRTF